MAIRLSRADREALADIYGQEIPEWLRSVSKNRIVISAAQYEGASTKNIVITPKDVVDYYHTQARNITSGIRTLAGFSSDWRMVDNMAKESLEIFKVLNRPALEREGKKHGMTLQ